VADWVARGPVAGSWRTLGLRVASALVLAPLALGAVWFGDFWMLALVALAAGIMTHEWQSVTFGAADPFGVAIAGVAVAGLAAAIILPQLWPMTAPMAGLLAPGLIAVSARARGNAPGQALLGACYVVLPCIALVWLRAEPVNGRIAVIWLLLSVWATDTGAYAAGRMIGGPKLAPRISPNKTWAGLLGGMAAAGLVGALTARWSGLAGGLELALAGMVLAVVAQAGDLTESAWKRRYGVKDSGHLIPGHGGLLDRVDGLLFAALGAAILALTNGGRLLPWQ